MSAEHFYDKQTFVDNQTILTAAHMQHIEDGLQSSTDLVFGQPVASNTKPETLGSEAVYAHPKGSLFIIGNKIAKATKDIAIGDTISVASSGNSAYTSIVSSVNSNALTTGVQELTAKEQHQVRLNTGTSSADATNKIEDELGLIIPRWEHGRFDSTGIKIPATDRARTVEPVPVTAGETIVIVMPSGHAGTLYQLAASSFSTKSLDVGINTIELNDNTVSINFVFALSPRSDAPALDIVDGIGIYREESRILRTDYAYAEVDKKITMEDLYTTDLFEEVEVAQPTWVIGSFGPGGNVPDITTRIRSSYVLLEDPTIISSFELQPDENNAANDGESGDNTTDDSTESTMTNIEFRVGVFRAKTDTVGYDFIRWANEYGENDVNVEAGVYARILIRDADDHDHTMVDPTDLDNIPSMLKIKKVQINNSQNVLRGKKVAILGDSISTTGTTYRAGSTQEPELILTQEDVENVNSNNPLRVRLSYRDFHPYASNGTAPEDTSDEKPRDGSTVHDLKIGDVTYKYIINSGGVIGYDVIEEYVDNQLVDSYEVGSKDTVIYSVFSNDINKHFGQADNHNSRKKVRPVWWEIAADALGFIPINASFSGSCICRARNHPTDSDSGLLPGNYNPRHQHRGDYAWSVGQIRRCGTRRPGSMVRESPDVIIIFRGTNDYGSGVVNKKPTIDTQILEHYNGNLSAYFSKYKDLVGYVDRTTGEVKQKDSTPLATDYELYGYVEAYLLTVLRMQQAYPYAKIFLCTLPEFKRVQTTYSTYPTRNDTGTMQQWNEAIRKVAKYTDCGVIDLAESGFNWWNCVRYGAENKTTSVHPYRDGQYVLGKRAIADLIAQYSPMFEGSIKDLLDDDNIVPCEDDVGFRDDPNDGPAYQYVMNKIKNHCVWNGIDVFGEDQTIGEIAPLTGVVKDIKVNGESVLYNGIANIETLRNDNAYGADLDVSDEDGNVIMRLADGHIKTKKFNSAVTSTNSGSDSTADLDISDVNGNVIMRFADGNIKTKNFDSSLIRNLVGKKWVVIGDSLTEHNQRATMNYHDYIAQETGVTVVNLGRSGRGYAKVADGMNFSGVVANIPSDADVITIFGSGNDKSLIQTVPLGDITDDDNTTLCGCINLTFDAIFAAFPLVPLGVITPTPWKNSEPSDGTTTMSQYCEKLVQICARRGIPCLDLYHCSNLHPNDSDFQEIAYSHDEEDGVHPDENGHKFIAPRFREFLFTLI